MKDSDIINFHLGRKRLEIDAFLPAPIAAIAIGITIDNRTVATGELEIFGAKISQTLPALMQALVFGANMVVPHSKPFYINLKNREQSPNGETPPRRDH